jgi:hypothetical protein
MKVEGKREFQLEMNWNDAGTELTIVAMDRRGDKPVPVQGLEPIRFDMGCLTKARYHAAAVSGLSKRIQDDTAIDLKGRKGEEVIRARHAMALEMVAFLADGGDEWTRARGPRVDETLEILIKALGLMRPDRTETECRNYLVNIGKDARYQLYTDRGPDNELWPFIQEVLAERTKKIETKALLAKF